LETKTIKIVSLDFDYEAVHSALNDLRKVSSEVDTYFADREENKKNKENDKTRDRFITSLHCTFAHKSNVSQAEMSSRFKHLIGATVEVTARSILFSNNVAAIDVEIPKCTSDSTPSPIPRPYNDFAHITLWCANKTSAQTSNNLPKQVKKASATRVAFKDPVVLKGVFKFWS